MFRNNDLILNELRSKNNIQWVAKIKSILNYEKTTDGKDKKLNWSEENSGIGETGIAPNCHETILKN